MNDLDSMNLIDVIHKRDHDFEETLELEQDKQTFSKLLGDKIHLALNLNSTTHTVDTSNDELHQVRQGFD